MKRTVTMPMLVLMDEQDTDDADAGATDTDGGVDHG